MARASGVAGEAPPDLWDPLVRITHWGLAVIVLVNALLTDGGSALHVWIGWTGMALLLLRLVWGVVGPREARFSAFPPDPRAALSHLAGLLRGRVTTHASHNPAGALMVYAFWAALAVVIATGLGMTGGATPMTIARQKAAVAAGDWSVLVVEGATTDDPSAGWTPVLQEVHAVAANLMLILAVLHVAGVVVESRAMRRNLLRPMLTGTPRPRRDE